MAETTERSVRIAAIRERVLNDADAAGGVANALTRERVEELRAGGFHRSEAFDFVKELLGPALASHVAADFGSYGEWAG